MVKKQPSGDRVVVCGDVASSSSSSSSDDQEKATLRDKKGIKKKKTTGMMKKSKNADSMGKESSTTAKAVSFSEPGIRLKNKRQQQRRLTKRQLTDAMQAKRERDRRGMVLPDVAMDREHERQLVRIATRGVVQLFNAVSERQSKQTDKNKKKKGKDEFKRKLMEEDDWKKEEENGDDGEKAVKRSRIELKRSSKQAEVVKMESNDDDSSADSWGSDDDDTSNMKEERLSDGSDSDRGI